MPVSQTSEPTLLQISATADMPSGKVYLEYSSVDIQNRSRISNAHCCVEFADAADWSSDWARTAFLIESRIQVLEGEMAGGNVERIVRGMAYKLFGALVQYGESYQGMEEVLLQSKQCEAAARVKFQTTGSDGNFFFSPYWIDSLAHLSGFVLNANDALDSKTQVFISHGWDSMRFAVPFSAEKPYRTYVKMQPETKSTIMAGNVYIFEDDIMVGLIEGLRFQQIPRTLLDHMLPPANKAAVAKRPATQGQNIRNSKIKPISSSKGVITGNVVAAKRPKGPSVIDRVKEIVATEVGIAQQDLSSRATFSELGIDSLLSLTIIGRLKEELDLSVASTIFLDYDTFGTLSKHLQESYVEDDTAITAASVSLTRDILAEKIPNTPPEMTSSSVSQTESSGTDPETETTNAVKTIIAEEMGLDLEDVSTTEPLGSLGMDSLMSLTILSALEEKTGLEVSPTFLADDPSIRDIEERLNPSIPPLPLTMMSTIT